MRRLLYGLAGGLGILLLLALVIPFFLRDKVDALLKAQINKSLNAVVDYNRLSLSFFRHFPALTLRLEGLRVVNKAPFTGDTLLACEALDVGVNVWKALKGEVEVTRFYLIRPRILAQVRRDGQASWAITLPDTTAAPKAAEPADTGAFRLALHRYVIQDGWVAYHDSAAGLFARLEGLTHTGQGDFSQKELQLETDTRIARTFFTMGETSYLTGQTLAAGIDLDIDFPNARYTLRRGLVQLNDLRLELSGKISRPDTLTTLLDLRFAAPKASLKELLSLIPAVFRKGYESLSTEGALTLEGYVQGELRDSLLPAFGLSLRVEKGKVIYKDLPKPLEDVEIRLKVENPASTLESLQVALDTFHLRAGSTRLSLRYRSRGLRTLNLEAIATGQGNLADFASALPLGYELRGNFDLGLNIQGTYAKNRLPAIAGRFSLQEGYVKAAAFPTAAENIAIEFAAESPDASPARTTATLRRLYAVVAGEPIEANLSVQNLEALNYQAEIKARADLEKLAHLLPLDSTQLAGKVALQLSTRGSREALEKHDYTRLPTQGSLAIQNLAYRSPALPQGLNIQQANFSFTPRYAELQGYKGTIGNSDIALDGRLENYLGYLLKDEKIIGQLSLRSNHLDLNQWVSKEPAPQPQQPADTSAPLEVVVLPANIDFTFEAQIGEMLYEKMRFRNARGRIILRDQALKLEGFEMEGFGGKFALEGKYIAPDKQNARWDMGFELRGVQVEEVVPHFPTIQKLSPIVKRTRGQVSLSLKAASALKPDLTPDLATLSGSGLVEVLQATVEGSTALSAFSAAAKLPALTPMQLSNTRIRFQLRNGELLVEPFTVAAGQYKLEVGGVTRLDQTIDYVMGLEVPASWAQGALQALGLPLAEGTTVRLLADVGGSVTQPKVKGIRPAQGRGGGVSEAATARLEAEKQRLEAELRAREDSLRRALEQKQREEAERLRREAEERARQEQERLRREAEERARQEQERLQREAEERARQLEEEKRKKEEELRRHLPFGR
ncbi:MAG: AsmA-like C-terminal region-containing protein [Bacteroidia bacterium]